MTHTVLLTLLNMYAFYINAFADIFVCNFLQKELTVWLKPGAKGKKYCFSMSMEIWLNKMANCLLFRHLADGETQPERICGCQIVAVSLRLQQLVVIVLCSS